MALRTRAIDDFPKQIISTDHSKSTISTQKLTPSSNYAAPTSCCMLLLNWLSCQHSRRGDIKPLIKKPTTLVLKRCQWNFIYFECSYLFVEKGRGTVRFVRGGDRKTLEGKRSCHLRQEKQGPWEEVGFTKRKFNLNIIMIVCEVIWIFSCFVLMFSLRFWMLGEIV